MTLHVEKTGEDISDVCKCCGHVTRTAWGEVHGADIGIAVYYVKWTENHVADLGSEWSIIFGSWGDDTTAADRSLVSLWGRHGDPSGFMVLDPPEDVVARLQSLTSNPLPRDEVLGGPIAAEIFSVVDAIYLQDERIIAMIGSMYEPN